MLQPLRADVKNCSRQFFRRGLALIMLSKLRLISAACGKPTSLVRNLTILISNYSLANTQPKTKLTGVHSLVGTSFRLKRFYCTRLHINGTVTNGIVRKI